MSLEHSPARAGHIGSPKELDNPDYWYGLIDEKAMAAFMGITDRTLQKWRQRGTGPRFVRLSHRCVKYRRIDGRVYSESLLRSSTSDRGAAA